MSSQSLIHPVKTRASRRRGTGIFNHLSLMFAIRRERLDLSNMSDHMLKDIGLDRGQASRESRRRFWDIPTR